MNDAFKNRILNFFNQADNRKNVQMKTTLIVGNQKLTGKYSKLKLNRYNSTYSYMSRKEG